MEIQPQHQKHQPGIESKMRPLPETAPLYPGVDKFKGQAVLISGGDSGIGRATAFAFANEGADIAIIYKEEESDAEETKQMVENGYGTRCLLIKGDIGKKKFCQQAVERTLQEFGRLDVLINNAAEQHEEGEFEDIEEEKLMDTFRTNVFGVFFLTQSALKYLPEKTGSIINTASVTAYRGSPELIDYSCTKGALVSFTRSLSKKLADRQIRVNAVAPGPIWTPLIPASFDPQKVKEFGKKTPLHRPGQPAEVAGAFTFLASKEASYITGQVIHPNGGEIINS